MLPNSLKTKKNWKHPLKSYDFNGDRLGAVRCQARHRTMSEKRQELLKSLNKLTDARAGSEKSPSGHRSMLYESNRTVQGRSPLKSYDWNFKPKSSGACPMSFYPQYTCTGAVECFTQGPTWLVTMPYLHPKNSTLSLTSPNDVHHSMNLSNTKFITYIYTSFYHFFSEKKYLNIFIWIF